MHRDLQSFLSTAEFRHAIVSREYLPEELWHTLAAQRWVVDHGENPGITCPECGETSDFPALFKEDRWWSLCYACRYVPIPEWRTREWRLVHSALAEFVTARLGFEEPPQPLVPERIWRCGRRRREGRMWTVAFACGLVRDDGPKCVEQSRLPDDTLWIVPHKIPARMKQPMVRMSDVITWSPQGFELEVDAVWAMVRGVEAPAKTKAVAKRSDRALNIEKLENALMQHIEAAKAHARAAKDYGETSPFVSRPSMKALAAQAGLKPVAVTRCFKDPSAKVLRLLWREAGTLAGERPRGRGISLRDAT